MLTTIFIHTRGNQANVGNSKDTVTESESHNLRVIYLIEGSQQTQVRETGFNPR